MPCRVLEFPWITEVASSPQLTLVCPLICHQFWQKIQSKVLSEKKETKVAAHISVNFSHFVTNFVCLKKVIFIAFQRGVTHYCSFTMREIKAFFVKLVRN